jgi:hypothetical protein
VNTQKYKRKLTTILSADVAGYSRLMGEDEAATVKTLERNYPPAEPGVYPLLITVEY